MRKLFSKNTTDQYYDSIETMPIYNWNKIIETGELKWLFKDGGRVCRASADKWEELQNEYFEEFGIDQEFKKRIRLMKEIIRLNDEFIQTGDRFLLNLINISEFDLKAMSQIKEVKFYDLLDKVMTIKKMFIDPKVYPVKLWYYTLKNLSNGKADQG